MTNGLYFLGNQTYSGIIKDDYHNGTVKSYASIYQGMLHGRYKSFYESGNPSEVRLYKNNLSTGRHYGFWPEKGVLKFDYTYYEEKREGKQRRWYRSGQPYIFANYVDDHEEGLQQGWRENGKLYLNYVAKEGYTYGLQKTALCYSLRDQKIKLKQ
ncbi:toxin-antitoxin system YwqK family antitoxin [Spirosoma koreense]